MATDAPDAATLRKRIADLFDAVGMMPAPFD
jgi:hypothetical protein